MSYLRVIPRDLFNEAKLLKCLGKISLMIHDNQLPFITVNHEDEREGFKIEQSDNDGSIYVSNLHFFDNSGTPLYFYHPLNSKANWSLMLDYNGNTYFCFDDNGKFMPSISLFNAKEKEKPEYVPQFLSWAESYEHEVLEFRELIEGRPADAAKLKQEYEILTGKRYKRA